MKDEEYLAFSRKLIPDTKYPMIGIRMPELRSFAKELLRSGRQDELKDESYEEVLLRGLCIGGSRCPWAEKKRQIDAFLPFIDNWAICDSFVSSLKDIRKHKEDYYPSLKRYLASEEEFYQRYALVVLLNCYIDETYQKDLYRILAKQDYEGYYSKMAGAWLLSYLFIFDFEETISFVKDTKLDPFVYQKGIRKALDSYRLDDKQKQILKALD